MSKERRINKLLKEEPENLRNGERKIYCRETNSNGKERIVGIALLDHNGFSHALVREHVSF